MKPVIEIVSSTRLLKRLLPSLETDVLKTGRGLIKDPRNASFDDLLTAAKQQRTNQDQASRSR